MNQGDSLPLHPLSIFVCRVSLSTCTQQSKVYTNIIVKIVYINNIVHFHLCTQDKDRTVGFFEVPQGGGITIFLTIFFFF